MLYGAIFGKKHTKEDYDAIMNYASITPPSIKENYVDIAGGDSSIDLSESVGGVVFSDGKIDFKFTFPNEDMRNAMKNDLHGKRLQIILEKEPDYFYDGRISCDRESRNGNVFELYMTAKVKPYKQEKRTTIHIENINGAEKEIIIPNTRMPTMPIITVEGNVYMVYENTGYSMKTGVYEIPEVTFYEGYNRIRLSGNGSVKFEYRKGMII